jgi:hypothetical protein
MGRSRVNARKEICMGMMSAAYSYKFAKVGYTARMKKKWKKQVGDPYMDTLKIRRKGKQFRARTKEVGG